MNSFTAIRRRFWIIWREILLNKKLRDYPQKWWSRSFLYVLFLQALEPVKIPFLRHELFIASDLGDATVFDKGDTVGLADGGKPVSDNEGGAFFHHVVGGLLNFLFGGGVKG